MSNPTKPQELDWKPGPVPPPDTMPAYACGIVWRDGFNGTAPEVRAIIAHEDPVGNKHWIYDRAGEGSHPILPIMQDMDIDEEEWTPPDECTWWALTGQAEIEID